MTNDFVLSPDPDDGDPIIDADVDLITAYLGRELSLAQIIAVEERLERDAMFRENVGEIIESWVTPGSFRPRTLPGGSEAATTATSLTNAEIVVGWQRYTADLERQRAQARARRAAVAPIAHPRVRRRVSMPRIAAVIAVLAVPLLALPKVVRYVAQHRAAPGHSAGDAIATPPNSVAPASSGVDRSQPPRVEGGAGGFTIHHLTGPPGPIALDSGAWRTVSPDMEAKTITAPSGQFALRLEKATSDDITFFRIWLTAGSRTPVQIDLGTATYAYITPDSRWIITGTLEAIDVQHWRRYSLSRSLNIEPWVMLRAISADGRRLLVSRQPCAFDCQAAPVDYYELVFPVG